MKKLFNLNFIVIAALVLMQHCIKAENITINPAVSLENNNKTNIKISGKLKNSNKTDVKASFVIPNTNITNSTVTATAEKHESIPANISSNMHPAEENTSKAAGFYLPDGTTTSSAKVTVVVETENNEQITLRFLGNTPGKYLCEEGVAGIIFTNSNGQEFDANSTLNGATCEIDVTKYGEVGDRIEGTFTANAILMINDAPGKSSKKFNGSFNVIREKDHK